jgi:hypothetical protein
MRTILLVAIGLAVASPANAQSAERLVSPALSGFVVGHNAANARQSIREEVPRGESVQGWTRMVTTQRFGGLARQATAAQYVRNVMAAVPGACPGARVSPLANVSVSGREAARFQLDCPRNPAAGNRPETFILLAIAGPSDIHVKQVAWRGAVTQADLAWGRGFLEATVFCASADRNPACRR